MHSDDVNHAAEFFQAAQKREEEKDKILMRGAVKGAITAAAAAFLFARRGS